MTGIFTYSANLPHYTCFLFTPSIIHYTQPSNPNSSISISISISDHRPTTSDHHDHDSWSRPIATTSTFAAAISSSLPRPPLLCFEPNIHSRPTSSSLNPYFQFQKQCKGAVKLELRCPQSVGGVVIDPHPDWSFDSLLSELSSIEKRLNSSSPFPLPFTKTKFREVSSAKSVLKGGFVMRVDETENVEEDIQEEDHDRRLVAGRRFTCDEFYISDDSEDESPHETQYLLMEKVGLVEGALSELTHEHRLSITEEIRNQILALETDLLNENKKFTSSLAQVKKYTEARREMHRKLDMQYQRRIMIYGGPRKGLATPLLLEESTVNVTCAEQCIAVDHLLFFLCICAEALDNHLTAIQRDHEHKSQIEERKIRDDAAIEEAKRREKALQEEKLWQEKVRAETEARLEAEKKRAEEAKAAALEAAEKVAAEDLARAAAAVVAPKEATSGSGILKDQSNKSGSDGVKKVQQAGNIIKCAESALTLEEKRLQIYKEVAVKNEALGLGASSVYGSHVSKIQRLIKQVSGTKENIRNKVDQLTKIFFDSSCPQSISIAMFAEKIIDQCVNPNKALFAYAHVIVLVASQVPLAMDLVLAKLNRVCIYTVPKYINYSKSAFDTNEAYHKAIGYKEEDGEIESEESYVSRIESYMKLYGALVQTQVESVQNRHGMGEGWAWLARFLNALPANLYTAVALQAFLEAAGFGLYRRYKSHFKKLLNVIYRDFVNALKQRGGDAKLNKVITSIQTYIESNRFLEEPEGRSLQGSLLSHTFVPESEYSEPSYHRPANRFYYQY
ncbi:unnamed protein product [Camellia sinensis]